MWLEWLEDEERLAMVSESDSLPSLVPEQVQYVLGLYDTAVRGDYRYYKVCRRYSKFVLKVYGLYGAAQGLVSPQTVRDVHEYILQIYGLEVNRSGKFWEPYLQFEMALLEGLKESEEERNK